MMIRLNKKIYPLAAVKEAVRSFRNLADLRLEIGKDHYLVRAENINSEFGEVFSDEFCNFVLGSIKN